MWICSKFTIKATGRRQWRRFGIFVVNFTEAATRSVVQENVLLEISQNSQGNTCARVPFLIKLQAEVCNFIKKETLAQMFSCEICEISKNTLFIEHLRVTASDFKNRFYTLFWCFCCWLWIGQNHFCRLGIGQNHFVNAVLYLYDGDVYYRSSRPEVFC